MSIFATKSVFRPLVLTTLMAFGWTNAAAAQTADYPNRPVRLIVPFSAGGGTDIIGRILADKLSQKFGQQFYIENRPGAGGTIGADAAAKSPPDGYTLLLYHVGMIAASLMYKPMRYDVQNDFATVSLVGSTPNVIAINPKLPTQNLAELVEIGRTTPKKFNYGTSGVGGSDHLAAELFQSLTGAKFTHVPYKGGGPAGVGAMTGEIEIVLTSAPSLVGPIVAGQLRGLAVTSKSRVPSMPDVPTTAEAGFPEFDQETWFAIWSPAGTPMDLRVKLSRALAEILKQDTTREALQKVGVDPRSNSPDEFRAMFDAEYLKWSKVLADAGLVK